MAAPAGLTIKTKVEDMQIGDCIPYRYQATSPAVGIFSELGTCTAGEIPVAGSATPNGLAYFIKVDKGLLISDRVVQHSISWDTLNTAKYIEGVISPVNMVPSMSSDTQNGYILTCSSFYNNGNSQAYRAFDGIADTSMYKYAWGTDNTITGWLGIEFPSSVVLNSYSLTGQYQYQDRSPKNWTFEGYDGTNWIILDTQINITGWTNSVYKTFVFNNKNAYKKYRINVSVINGGTLLTIGEIKLFVNCFIRSLSGGNAYLGTDGNYSLTDVGLGAWPINNEWDKFVRLSNLNNKITAGDDNIWHWNNVATICQDTPINGFNRNGTIGSSTHRINRSYHGTFFGPTQPWFNPSNLTDIAVGFRPVLEYPENIKQTNVWY